MDNTVWNETNSTLDLNGPILSFSEQPTGTTGIGTTAGATGGASISFTGIATGVEEGTGYLSYQWYEQDVGKLSDDTYITGTASTGPVGTAATLTLSNLITPTDNQRKFYVVTDYVASAYGTGKSTGNAWNEPLTSGIATATVTPLIEVIAQPSSKQAGLNSEAVFTVNSDLTDGYFTDDLQYQWYLDGEEVTDGIKTVTIQESTGTASTVSRNYTAHYFDSTGAHVYTEGVFSLDIPSDATDIVAVVAGAAGMAGGQDGTGVGGTGGGGRAGRFSLTASQVQGEKIFINTGQRGNGGSNGTGSAGGRGGSQNPSYDYKAAGGWGGNAGGSGSSGGGGGGGAGSFLSVGSTTGTQIVAAAGGGGGGGGSSNYPGNPATENYVFGGVTAISVSDGNGGDSVAADRDGGGGGGSGGGAPGRDGGAGGKDGESGGGGGQPGGSVYHTGYATLLGQWINDGDGYVNIQYIGYSDVTQEIVKKTTISGATSNTLTLKCDTAGIQTCQCKITSATASNSTIFTDDVNFITIGGLDISNVNVEQIGVTDTATSVSSINLGNGDYTFETATSDVATGSITKYTSFYSEKDLDVEMDLYGGKGDDKGSYTGGEGGYSRIRFTMKKDTEYVVVGLSTDLNAPYVYRKGELMACVGQGGEAGESGNGGNGGGVSNEGQDGRGREQGIGGVAIAEGTLGSNGAFGSQYSAGTLYSGDNQATGQDGGVTIRCTKGVYWAEQGYSACEDVGKVKFRLSGGTEVTNTGLITRGFKAGYNIIETAGAKDANGGKGGNGATGGSGGAAGGGGGGSGYNDGSITIVDTQQGGSSGDAKVILRIVT